MAVPFMDLSRLHKPYAEELVQAFESCLSNNDFVLGATLQSFEHNFGRAMNSPHAIGVASGTDALLLTLQAIGVGPGDEVICPAFGFVATTDVVLRLGATVVFVDVREDYTIDAQAVRAAITEKTKAVIAVHMFGLTADLDQLIEIASDYSLYLVEDCAQSTGAIWAERSVGSFGIAGCFSFYPTKNLGGLGDGGMVATESEELALRLKLYRDHGRQDQYYYTAIGYNSRLDSIQAAALDIKLESLKEDNADRVANASFYEEKLDKEIFTLPPYRTDGSHVYNQYTIRYAQREELRNFLAERQIETQVYYPIPLHLQPCFEFLGYQEGHFPVSEKAAAEVLSIPIYPGLSRRELDEVAHTIDLYVKTRPVSTPS